ncbi:MAG TPA: hypothetical protein VIM73_09065 [Polyangiaceae bacterium]
MSSLADFRLALIAAASGWVLALGCGGRAEANRDEPDQNPPAPPSVPPAVQEATAGVEAAYRALCVCHELRLPGSSCGPEDFEGYDPDAMRETLERHAERGDGFTECIGSVAWRISACLSAEHGCERGACPDATALLDDSEVLAELGESCSGG